MNNLWEKLYEFELDRRKEINENLRHTFQLSLAELGFLFFLPEHLSDANLSTIMVAAYWITAVLSVITVAICTFAFMAFGTAFPNSARELSDYKNELKAHDADKADDEFKRFLEERWNENATKNADRNRSKSRLSFLGRIALTISAIPLLLVMLCYLSIRIHF